MLDLGTDTELRSRSWSRSDVLAEIKKNYPLALLCILPGVEDRTHKIKSAAKRMGIESEEFEFYREMLIGSGLWKIEGSRIEASFELLDLGDLTIQDYMAMTINIIARLSSERSHEYEYLSLVTNLDLIKSFVGKVRKSLKELYNESQALSLEQKTCVFSWTHAGAVENEVSKTTGSDDE